VNACHHLQLWKWFTSHSSESSAQCYCCSVCLASWEKMKEKTLKKGHLQLQKHLLGEIQWLTPLHCNQNINCLNIKISCLFCYPAGIATTGSLLLFMLFHEISEILPYKSDYSLISIYWWIPSPIFPHTKPQSNRPSPGSTGIIHMTPMCFIRGLCWVPWPTVQNPKAPSIWPYNSPIVVSTCTLHTIQLTYLYMAHLLKHCLWSYGP